MLGVAIRVIKSAVGCADTDSSSVLAAASVGLNFSRTGKFSEPRLIVHPLAVSEPALITLAKTVAVSPMPIERLAGRIDDTKASDALATGRG